MTTLDLSADEGSLKLHRMLFDRVRCLFSNTLVESGPAGGQEGAMPSETGDSSRIRCVDATALVMRDGAVGG